MANNDDRYRLQATGLRALGYSKQRTKAFLPLTKILFRIIKSQRTSFLLTSGSVEWTTGTTTIQNITNDQFLEEVEGELNGQEKVDGGAGKKLLIWTCSLLSSVLVALSCLDWLCVQINCNPSLTPKNNGRNMFELDLASVRKVATTIHDGLRCTLKMIAFVIRALGVCLTVLEEVEGWNVQLPATIIIILFGLNEDNGDGDNGINNEGGGLLRRDMVDLPRLREATIVLLDRLHYWMRIITFLLKISGGFLSALEGVEGLNGRVAAGANRYIRNDANDGDEENEGGNNDGNTVNDVGNEEEDTDGEGHGGEVVEEEGNNGGNDDGNTVDDVVKKEEDIDGEGHGDEVGEERDEL
ncbi:hypothetical protein K435DRAFT_858160 [Dendrothele bispora CBS 962.96]|uniref:Uncharacterized protein n=1 Tax=Dendrothele bispora (strain CBS 962.96) TaxID=1314807 RepID=A0A4S8M594_DENBC|nr:hypothetical protein K435DRAFT_858160 [Dendrothele bispora CBS 962.96]